ncbi:AbrB/MazE/SpoVT family DNA-binding domain-containing protein [Candidatus Binatia bacterium]|nr:AbrB/MazE/SpoVT family DNA-binding domain-containing protein [Candidatus Binatia bacterium]
MRVTSKGQVTIPQEIREKAHLLPGSEVEFEYRRGQVILRTRGKATTRGERAIARARGAADNPRFKGWTTDRIMQVLRGDGE